MESGAPPQKEDLALCEPFGGELRGVCVSYRRGRRGAGAVLEGGGGRGAGRLFILCAAAQLDLEGDGTGRSGSELSGRLERVRRQGQSCDVRLEGRSSHKRDEGFF